MGRIEVNHSKCFWREKTLKFKDIMQMKVIEGRKKKLEAEIVIPEAKK